MKVFLTAIVLIVFWNSLAKGQNRSELESKQKETLLEIEYVDNLLQNTAKEKEESISAVRIIGKKLNLRESVIQDLQDETALLNGRIELNTIAIDMMETDVEGLKSEYRRAIVNSYKLLKSYPPILYIISAKDFNQGYKRVKYLQQFEKFRKAESETIIDIKSQVETTRQKLKDDLLRISDLKSREEIQKSILLQEQNKRQSMINSLTGKEKQLKKELEEKKRIAEKIENEIEKLIEEERKKAGKVEITEEQRLTGNSFGENMGKLPWPVEKGVITGHFGIQQHPVLKYLTEENIGIEITGEGKMTVRSVFKGEVVRVFAIRGANWTVIIRHGKYLTVYANIVNLKIKRGDIVSTNQQIGEVYTDPVSNSYVLKFMIFETKYQDPELWITKNHKG